jgi:hypothetical protein
MADEKTDVFAFGVVLWELLTQEKPHFGFKSHQVQDFTLSGQRPPIKSLPFGFDPRFVDIICACWHQVPQRSAPSQRRASHVRCRTRACGRLWRWRTCWSQVTCLFCSL